MLKVPEHYKAQSGTRTVSKPGAVVTEAVLFQQPASCTLTASAPGLFCAHPPQVKMRMAVMLVSITGLHHSP